LKKNTIFTNVALTKDGDVWWEGMTKEKPSGLIDWHGKPFDPKSTTKAAHGNARFCVPISQCPILDPKWDVSEGVPISAILFGGRRNTTIPLVLGSNDWNHGVLLGASISSEQTEAAEGRGLRHDPFAMLPFCGYNMGKYFNHWIQMGKKTKPENLPKIFQVNWFRKDEKGNFLWPGYGENSRVLKWIFEMCENKEGISKKTPVGTVPSENGLDENGLNLTKSTLHKLFEVDKNQWNEEMNEVSKYLETFGEFTPKELKSEIERVKKALNQ